LLCILLGVGVGLRVMHNSFVYSPSRQHSMLSTESSKKYDLTYTYRVRQNKVAPKVFLLFSQQPT